jgi:iron complex transport system substrate-binding protein
MSTEPASTSRPLRIVSLLPSATEIVCAVGAADELVGISHECDFPTSIRDRPALTRARVPTEGSSGAIDAAVRAVVRDALSVYTVDEERLATLAPDVVVTQDLCEVCAVSLDDVRSAVARLAHRDAVTIVSLRPTRLRDVFDDVERVAAAVGRAAQGRTVRAELQRRLDAIAARAAALPTRPRVVSLEWIDPLMLGGTWMPELIELAGGVPTGVAAGAPAKTVSAAELKALAPEVILVKPCGFSLERALRERGAIEAALAPLLAAGARAYASDGNAYFNRPGPRLVESLEILAACVHPEGFADLADKHKGAIRPLGA